MSAVRCPVVIENFHIFHSGQCENTFNMFASYNKYSASQRYNIFVCEQTLIGEVLPIYNIACVWYMIMLEDYDGKDEPLSLFVSYESNRRCLISVRLRPPLTDIFEDVRSGRPELRSGVRAARGSSGRCADG